MKPIESGSCEILEMFEMVDCSKELEKYWDEKVKLSQDKYYELMEKRDAQIRKLIANLSTEPKYPQPVEFINQGSYAMKTLIQQDDEYDIDVGVVFEKSALDGLGRSEPAYIKYHIGKKLKDDRFAKPPSVLKNCVRVNYKENYHIDMPVFRKNGYVLELASGSSWESSNPKHINQWFQAEKANKPHLKKIVQLLKKWSKSRSEFKNTMPSGLILSILASECYCYDQRLDKSFYATLSAINLRLQRTKMVQLPNTTSIITSSQKHQKKVANLSEKLKSYFNGSFKLYGEEDKQRALKVWKHFFADRYFEGFLE